METRVEANCCLLPDATFPVKVEERLMNFLTNYCHHPTKVSTLNLSLSFLTQHISDRIVPSLTFLHNFVAVFRTFG